MFSHQNFSVLSCPSHATCTTNFSPVHCTGSTYVTVLLLILKAIPLNEADVTQRPQLWLGVASGIQHINGSFCNFASLYQLLSHKLQHGQLQAHNIDAFSNDIFTFPELTKQVSLRIWGFCVTVGNCDLAVKEHGGLQTHTHTHTIIGTSVYSFRLPGRR
jgi:hypothetical protein